MPAYKCHLYRGHSEEGGKGIKMVAKIALMIVAISVAVVMTVSCVMPGIGVDDLYTHE